MSVGNEIYGFFGSGKMAQALAQGFMESELVKSENIISSYVSGNSRKVLEGYGVNTTQDNAEVARKSSVLFLAVKPHIIDSVLPFISDNYDNQLVLSLAAGITIQHMEERLPAGCRVIRLVPNTPSLVRHGATVYSLGTHATEVDAQLVETLCGAVGLCERLPERLLNAVTGVSGSGPAYGFLAIEALADGGVRMGLPRDVAMRLAAQTLKGAASMVLQTGKHPGELKDGVCSPGGTTIAAVHSLEKGNFRATLMNAVESAATKSEQLGS